MSTDFIPLRFPDLNDTDKVLERQKWPMLTQEKQANKQKNWIALHLLKKLDLYLKTLWQNYSGTKGLQCEFNHTLEGIIPFILKVFHKIKEEDTLPNTFNDIRIYNI